MADIEAQDLTSLTVDLLSAYFENNSIESDRLADLIKTTHAALKALGEPEQAARSEHVPAVSIRKSLGSPGHIISLIDGKPYKTLKRHLGTHGLTPAEYRERYKLPADYPMVAKSYSQHRRDVAEKLGLGRKGRKAAAGTDAAEVNTPKAAAPARPKASPIAKPGADIPGSPAADAPKTGAKRGRLKLNLSALKGVAEPVAD